MRLRYAKKILYCHIDQAKTLTGIGLEWEVEMKVKGSFDA